MQQKAVWEDEQQERMMNTSAHVNLYDRWDLLGVAGRETYFGFLPAGEM